MAAGVRMRHWLCDLEADWRCRAGGPNQQDVHQIHRNLVSLSSEAPTIESELDGPDPCHDQLRQADACIDSRQYLRLDCARRCYHKDFGYGRRGQAAADSERRCLHGGEEAGPKLLRGHLKVESPLVRARDGWLDDPYQQKHFVLSRY